MIEIDGSDLAKVCRSQLVSVPWYTHPHVLTQSRMHSKSKSKPTSTHAQNSGGSRPAVNQVVTQNMNWLRSRTDLHLFNVYEAMKQRKRVYRAFSLWATFDFKSSNSASVSSNRASYCCTYRSIDGTSSKDVRYTSQWIVTILYALRQSNSQSNIWLNLGNSLARCKLMLVLLPEAYLTMMKLIWMRWNSKSA